MRKVNVVPASQDEFEVHQVTLRAVDVWQLLDSIWRTKLYSFRYVVVQKVEMEKLRLFMTSVLAWPLSYTVLPAPINVTAVPNTNSASISVSWKWNSSQFHCIKRIVVVYSYVHKISDKNPRRMTNKLNTISATSYTLQNLTCNRQYTVLVRSVPVHGSAIPSEEVKAILPAMCIGKTVINYCRDVLFFSLQQGSKQQG